MYEVYRCITYLQNKESCLNIKLEKFLYFSNVALETDYH